MLLLTNSRIYTGFKGQPIVSALLIHDDRILAAGMDDEIKAIAPPGTPCEDMGGKIILPGFTDTHMHLKLFSMGLQSVYCETDTIQECIKNVGEKATTLPKGSWITGWGWNQNVWPEGFGTAEMLDKVSPEHPVMLSAKSGHAAWANSLAMKIAGVTRETSDPQGGVIQRDADGQPTGIFFETADHLVSQHIPEPTLKQIQDAVLNAQSELWKMGVTGVHDFDTTDLFSTLQVMDKEKSLRLRITKGIPLAKLDQAIEIGLRSGFGSDFLRTGSVKIFMDGALGPQTAAMLEPFEGSESLGILLLQSEEVFEIGKKASQNGLSLAIHAIGDLANRTVLDGYQKLRQFERENSLPALRHRIEHVQLLHPKDYSRLAELGIIASMQPIHATSDMFISDRFWGKRAQGTYAFRTLLNEKTMLTFGSDAPVETPNPFVGIHAAVTRRRSNGDPGENGWYPDQRLTLDEALHAYTYAPAYTTGIEHRSGVLSSGYYADLIVLDQDPFDLPPQELHHIKPSCTMVGGSWVWRKD